MPGVGGICAWSPPLDSIGNSVRGLEFARRFSERFRFHCLSPLSASQLTTVACHTHELRDGHEEAKLADPQHQQQQTATRASRPSRLCDLVDTGSKSDAIEALIHCCLVGDLRGLKTLVALGIDLEQPSDIDGRTALHAAALTGQIDVVQYLISKGVTLDPLDFERRTPLDLAECAGFSGVSELLNSAPSSEFVPKVAVSH